MPICMAVGELKPGKSNTLEVSEGKYYLTWLDSNKILYNTNKFNTDGLFVYVNGDIKESDIKENNLNANR